VCDGRGDVRRREQRRIGDAGENVSGTGPFRHPWISARTPAEEHLGDRLAAFVDGELGHDMRERVAAHLATCEQCKAEADEQRRLKEAVAGAMPPALSAGLLARLQGLPGGGPDGRHGGPGDNDGPFGGGVLGRVCQPTESADVHFGLRAGLGGRWGFGEPGPEGEADSYLAPGRSSALAPTGERLEGFRIHDIVTAAAGAAGRSASRGRRFAFVAAGAFSMAAIALGGALPLDTAIEGGAAAGSGAAAPSANPVSQANRMSQASRATVRGVPRATRQEAGALGAEHIVGVTPVSYVQRLLAPQDDYEHNALPSLRTVARRASVEGGGG
jgi:hypothetical protein